MMGDERNDELGERPVDGTDDEFAAWVKAWSAKYDREHPEPSWMVNYSFRHAAGYVVNSSFSFYGCTKEEAETTATKRLLQTPEVMAVTAVNAVALKDLRRSAP